MRTLNYVRYALCAVVLLCFLVIAGALPEAVAQKRQPNTLRQIAMLDLPGKPGFDAVVFAAGHLVMAHKGADTVDIFEPTKRRLVAQVNNVADPRGIVADEANNRVYIAAAGSNSIVVISSQDWQVQGVIGLGQAPESLLMLPKGAELAVTKPLARTVAFVPTNAIGQQKAERESVEVGGRPQKMAWDPQKNQVYVTVEETAEVVAISPAQGEVAKRMKLTASQPTGLVFEPNSRQLFVAARYAVLQVDAETGREISRVPAPPGTSTLWLEAQSNTLFASGVDGSVQIINVGPDRLTAQEELVSAVRGNGLAYDPANKLLFLPGGREGKSKLVILKQFGAALPAGVESAKR
jgi:DNA-binding beta-propeller fold protein YncE